MQYQCIQDFTLGVSTPQDFIVRKGEHVRISVPKGGTVGDFVAFSISNLKERFDQARTKVNNQTIRVTKGHYLYTKSNKIMFTIVEDTYGWHDLQYGMCSKWVFENVAQQQELCDDRDWKRPERGCWENLSSVLEPWGIDPMDIPSPFNIFQTIEIDTKSGKMVNLPTNTKPGDYVELKAEMDCLCAITNSPIWNQPLRVQVFVVLDRNGHACSK